MISHLAAIEERMPRKLRVLPSRTGTDATVLHEDGERPREPPRSPARLTEKHSTFREIPPMHERPRSGEIPTEPLTAGYARALWT